MASDHKHRRSSDDELQDSSKRHKHRRHHHHHHRRHRHKNDEEQETKQQGDETAQIVLVSNANWQPHYDMEEGEIFEDDINIQTNNLLSDAESGEIKEGIYESQIKLDFSSNLPLEDDDCSLVTNATTNRKENISDDNRMLDGDDLQINLSANGDIGDESCKEGENHHPSSWFPEGNGNRKTCYDDDGELRDNEKSFSSENAGRRLKPVPSSRSYDRHCEEVHGRGRSRSRSRSILQEDCFVQLGQRGAAYYSDGKHKRDSDDEGVNRHNRDYRHGSRDMLSAKGRERSSSYSRRSGQVDRHHSRESWDRERERNRETWYRDREGGERESAREREKDRERKRERERGREHSSSYSRRSWQVDRHHSRETRDRDREESRETRDRDREGRERESYREREKERERVSERVRERKHSEVNSNRDKDSDTVSRHRKYYDIDDRCGDRGRDTDYRHQRLDEIDHRDSSRRKDQEKNYSSKRHPLERDHEKLKRDEVEQEDYQERIVLQLAEHEEEDINKIKEESRRRRQAILEKYKTQQLQQQREHHLVDMGFKEKSEQPSQPLGAANIVPEALHRQSEGVDTYLNDIPFSVGKSRPQNGMPAFEKTSGTGGLGEGTPKSERSDDSFCDDIFGESPAGVRKSGREDGLAIERSGLHDNWDDADGYYSYRFGEILDARYEVIAAHGKGVFSTVVRAKDLKAGPGDSEEVAIKIIRNNDTMYKAGLEELVILKKLIGADLEDKRHCVRFLSSFKYRSHLCLVFESLHMNLREVLKKFGRNIGLKLTAVRAYAKQLFIALKHLRNCGVLHCDIKPDNMLVNDAKNVLKLCDFGSAMFAGKNEITPYLVSRFYRAPEIMLGLPYDHPVDIWSVGCCLFELYTGKVLFPGPSNNDMLRLHMELKGPFPKKMLRKGAFTDQHFDQDLNFFATEEDPVTKKTIKRLILNIKPKDIGRIVLSSPGEEDPKMLVNFKDLLEKLFVLDPEKRITVSQALNHPFITGK